MLMFAQVKTPFIVLRPHQPKTGQRLPADLPIVVNAERMRPRDNRGQDRLRLLRWMHMFISLSRAPHRGGPIGRNYVGWGDDTLEEIDLETCPRRAYPGEEECVLCGGGGLVLHGHPRERPLRVCGDCALLHVTVNNGGDGT